MLLLYVETVKYKKCNLKAGPSQLEQPHDFPQSIPGLSKVSKANIANDIK